MEPAEGLLAERWMQLRTGSAVLATACVALGVSAPSASAARESLNAPLGAL
jgi:hypothetical protein